jgi:dipeptidyl aminopeptidase/acylaminoacyl peptidase
MTIRATRFDPKVLLSAPRRSAGVPNATGSHILFTLSSYDFSEHSKKLEFRVSDTRSGENTLLLEGKSVEGVSWLREREFVWLQAADGENGGTEIWVGSLDGKGFYVAGRVKAEVGGLKVKTLSKGGIAVVVSALAGRDGELFDKSKAVEKHSTGRLYTGLYVRHWDKWEEGEKSALWIGRLEKGDGEEEWRLSELRNILKGTGLESPIAPFGGVDCFDLSERGVVFVSKDPKRDPALNTKGDVYLVEVEDWKERRLGRVRKVEVQDFEGAAMGPVWDREGKRVAFLKMKRNGYESDRNWVFVVGDLDGDGELRAECEGGVVAAQAEWDRSPSAIAWTSDGEGLLAVAEDEGRARLWLLKLGQGRPFALTEEGSVGNVVPLDEPGWIFYSCSSMIDNSLFAIIEVSEEQTASSLWTHSNSNHGNKFGLKKTQISSIWTPASNPKVNKEVHSWVIKPSKFDSSKKYPVAYLIHGGPQGAWGDSWSTRWNPTIFAEQGFIVITPNITGSTGYGQDFTDAINRNWGGDPLVDIENAFNWVGEHMPEADNDRAVALGASYGGYMMNCSSLQPLLPSLTF